MRRRPPALAALGTLVLALAALACTCGPLTRLGELRATFQAADATLDQFGQLGPTLEAELTALGPTLQAEGTRLIQQATLRGPELNLTMTAVVATADAMLNPGAMATFDMQMTNVVGTLEAGRSEGQTPAESTPEPPAQPGGDLPPATLPAEPGDTNPSMPLVEWLAFGETRTVRIADASIEHNWLFEGSAGQSVTVDVRASGEASPVVAIISPEGATLADLDAQGEPSATVSAVLPTGEGIYTARVSLSAPGEYTITLSSE